MAGQKPMVVDFGEVSSAEPINITKHLLVYKLFHELQHDTYRALERKNMCWCETLFISFSIL